ncbi:hypothetical protein [Ketobacter alkanivorans]|uniref:DnaK suppressor protein-like N-terminal domain-containing protein n=1 Tax=Ketobacter alkanivorans TaxID=1917421 RepID=A0A2K9LFW9_9GAMM|nr:hypothetical protein [Ketobacter alkanivorans]AUM11140.1 hypothetical protein Kalk_01245 [Ketobacter alkanivorans]MCP5017354.1 hypothetical protein [Ketobacter sp.]
MTIDLQAKKAELLSKREELLNRLDAIKKDYANGLSADSEEQALQLENAEVLAEISRVTNEDLQKVTQAIERIEHELAQ